MIDTIKPLIKQFLPFAQERMGFRDPPKLFIREDEENAQNPLGKTAFYNPGSKSVTLYVTGRHPKDVMRSLSHELVHHTQNCNGHFDNVGEMGDGYAQNDEHLREMERQAYEIGNLCFRDWEDSIKHTIYFEHLQKGVEKVMSIKDWKNGEIKSLLSEAWGFKMDLANLNEGSEELKEVDPDTPVTEDGSEDTLQEDSGEDEARHEWKNEHADDDHIREIEHHLRSLKDDRDYERHGAEDDDDKFENEGLEEMCGPDTEEPGHGEVIVMGDEEGVVGDEGADPSSRVAALMDELKGLLMQLAGGEEEVAVEEPMEEGGLANRKGDPRNKRPEASPVREDKLRAMVRKAIKEAMK